MEIEASLGGDGLARICRSALGGSVCGLPATIHVCWSREEQAASSPCGAHWMLLRVVHHKQHHKLGPDCGMPGAEWDFELNECLFSEPLFDHDRIEDEFVADQLGAQDGFVTLNDGEGGQITRTFFHVPFEEPDAEKLRAFYDWATDTDDE